MSKIILMFGGIGDSIMAYEQLQHAENIEAILATDSVRLVLQTVDCSIPIKKISLSVNPSKLSKLKNLYQISIIYSQLFFKYRNKKIIVFSFMRIWSLLPFLQINHFPKKYKHLPRSNAIKNLLK